MADLISRAAAIDALTNTNLKRNVDSVYDGDMNRTRRAAQRVIAQLPAVDAVPVVRCSECKYAHMTYDGECKYCDFWQEDGGDALYLDKGFYCAAGERRDGDTNG